MRRPLWLAAGTVLGAGATLWAQRRAREFARVVRGEAGLSDVVDHVVSIAGVAGRGSRKLSSRLGNRVRCALDAGAEQSERRREELQRSIPVRS